MGNATRKWTKSPASSSAPSARAKAKRINIMMDEGLIEAIDRIASNRSGFLADAARMAIAARRESFDGQ
jgi:hypothetical protein